jgi:ATP-dependent Clp protease ATP-binding subunit ClpC
MMKSGSGINSKMVVGMVASAVAFVAISKVMGMIPSMVWLLALLFGLPVIIYFRMKQVHRQDNPEMKGNLERLRATNFHQPYHWIQQNLMGHQNEVKQILNQIEQNLHLAQRGRHLGAYLLMGPTGTGKTFFAHLLAESLFGKGKILTIPMGQYSTANSDPDAILMMILAYQKQSPEFVILLDEFDRAHSQVKNALFHFLDQGEIVHPETQERYMLPCTVILATTNLGENYLAKGKISTQAQARTALAQSGFEKPLLARFEGVYHFATLNPVEVISVTLLQLRTYYRDHGLYVSYVGPEILFMILQGNQEYKEYGVRQLHRLVKAMSDPVIFEAKKRGLTSVVLEFDQVTKSVKLQAKRNVA